MNYKKGGFASLILYLSVCFFIFETFAQEKIIGHGGPVKGLTISPDEKIIVSSSFDYTSIIWSLSNMEEIFSINEHHAAVNKAVFSPNQKILVTIGDDMRVILSIFSLDNNFTDNMFQSKELGKHQGKVSDAKFSIDGSILATSSWDGQIIFWDMLKEEKMFATNANHLGPINCVQFSLDGKYLYSSGNDGTIRKFNIFNQESEGILIANGWGVNVFHLDENKQKLSYGTTDGVMVIYDLKKNKNIMKIGQERVPVLSMTKNKDNSIIAFGNSDGRVVIIDMNNLTMMRDFRAAYGPVWAMALNNKATHLFVGGLDDYINQWDLVTYPQPVMVPPGPARRFNPSDLATNGEKQFARKCSVCHSLLPDGKRRAGPTLYKLFGREAGTLEGYKFSKALIESDIIWNEINIHRLFTEGPDQVLPGTKMPIQRMKSSKNRVDLIKFLKEATNP